jgi:serine/threonine protein kinase
MDRDLKLENILLDKDGHIKVADFGLSKQDDEKSADEESFSGTVEYFSPEVLLEKKQSYSADWWAYGVVLFEMLCGFHPFYHSSRSILYARIIKSSIPFPESISPAARDLISKLLIKDPRQRLGSSQDGGSAIREQEFFSSIDFNNLFKRKIKPPFQPDIKDDRDVKYFDEEFTEQNPVITPSDSSSLGSSQEIQGFSYSRPDLINDNEGM